MIPLRDINPTQRTPVVTYALIATNVLVFVYQLGLDAAGNQALVFQWGMIPYWISEFRLESFSTIITSMFLHGGVAHVLFNMWSLYIFGDNVEDVLGRMRFFVFYIVCGVGAALAQVLIEPSSRVPMVGASGAISGVMAAYLKLFPHARIVTLIPVLILFFVREIPAVFFIVFWFLLQLLSGIGSLGDTASMGGVAFFAHIGGFVVGLYLVSTLRRPRNPTGGFHSPSRTRSYYH